MTIVGPDDMLLPAEALLLLLRHFMARTLVITAGQGAEEEEDGALERATELVARRESLPGISLVTTSSGDLNAVERSSLRHPGRIAVLVDQTYRKLYE